MTTSLFKMYDRNSHSLSYIKVMSQSLQDRDFQVSVESFSQHQLVFKSTIINV